MDAENLRLLVCDSSAKWHRRPPAALEAIEQLRNSCPIKLPEEYLEFLELSNGGYGSLPVSPLLFALWPAEQVMTNNKEHQRDEYYPGLFLIGSLDGNLFAFRIDGASTGAVIALDFLDSKRECVDYLGETFFEFASLFGRSNS